MELNDKTLFAKGTWTFDSERLKEMGLTAPSAEYLARRGLPMTDELNPPFGLIFHSASTMNDQNKSYIVIGREAWAKLRRGEIKPAKANPEQSAAMEKERKAAFQQLERELRVLDPAAMQQASWWSKVMEETGYGLL